MHPGNTAYGPHFQEVARVVFSCREDKPGAKIKLVTARQKKALSSLAKGAVPQYPSRKS